MDLDVVGLSRLQFALTALYHFLFVPLTLGLSMVIAIMETVQVAGTLIRSERVWSPTWTEARKSVQPGIGKLPSSVKNEPTISSGMITAKVSRSVSR